MKNLTKVNVNLNQFLLTTLSGTCNEIVAIKYFQNQDNE